MEQIKLFELPEETAITVDTVLATGQTCRECKHRERWQCNSKVFQYCGKRKSNRTSNGQLKIKCKDKACALFEPCCSNVVINSRLSELEEENRLLKLIIENGLGAKDLENDCL